MWPLLKLPSLVHSSNSMRSEYYNVLSIVFLYFCFDYNFAFSPRLTTATIILFSLVSTELVANMKIPSETDKNLLHTIAPALKSNLHERDVAGHSHRYSRTNFMLEVVDMVDHN